jgi:hypothetical protein
MCGNLRKTIKYCLKTGGIWADKRDQNMTFPHKAEVIIICCNVRIFIVYLSVLQDIFI